MNPSETPARGKVHAWLAMPMETAARAMIERISTADDVVHVAVMPDVHIANDVCVGTAMATRRLVYPSAVGGDIGCGMLAMAFDASADLLGDPRHAGVMLRAFGEQIPARRRHRTRTLPLPDELKSADLSHPSLKAAAEEEGQLEMGTLGGGNHFIEMQSDGNDRLWLMIHSGSRAIGQAVKAHHLARAAIRSAGLLALDADSAEGQAYVADQLWARRYAEANRSAMGQHVAEILRRSFRIDAVKQLTISCDHNHLSREDHLGQSLWVHRKGAMRADAGMSGALPGSMGTQSFHVEGLGNDTALCSAAHGAGRLLSRHAARERFSRADLRQQMHAVWYDPRLTDSLRDESPKCYKDVRAVMRAQSDLVKAVRTLRPLLVYKG